ncbi:MAG: flagellar hook-associated protein FlgK [Deltaproteobacteria bacterium]|nr:flagellar hook-associated protein FlgK [Deltaproteobacteria bacterium]
MSISSLLSTSRDALIANQMAIDITGGNIANVNTPGYTRQRLDLKSSGGVDTGVGTSQIGVTISGVERIYDRFIEARIIDQRQNTGYSDTLLQGLQNIEMAIDDTQGAGISDQLSKFWSSWGDLSKNPSGIVERSALLSTAQDLTDALATYKGNLDTITEDLGRSIADTVVLINEKVDEIADLNTRIMETVGDKGEKNDFLDKRMQALKELSALTNISQFENDNGTINIYLSNGEPLLQGTLTQSLGVRQNADGLSEVYASASGETVNGALTGGNLGALIELQGTIVPEYVNYIETFTQSFVDRVNEIHRDGFDAYSNTGVDFFETPNAVPQILGSAESLYDDHHDEITAATTWENVHDDAGVSAGLADGDVISFSGSSRTGERVSGSYTITDTATDTIEGLLNAVETAFGGQVTASIDASGQITVTDKVAGRSGIAMTFDYTQAHDLNFGAVSTTNPGGQLGYYGSGTIAGTVRVNALIAADINRIAASTSVTGNGENAGLIAAVQDELLMNNKTSSLGSFLAATVGQIGEEVAVAKINGERQTAIGNLLDNQRESVSGVSIDEEMIRLINYQMGYNAAGKLVTIVDEMLDTLMGLVD